MQTPRDWLAPCAASLMLALSLAASPAGAEEPMPCTVPELIGGLAGQVGIDMVALSGTFKLTPEGPALFEDKEHAETAAGKDMIPLRDALDGRKTDYKPFEGKRVTAVGKFTIYKPGESTASKGYVTAERINVDPTFVSLMELIVSPEKFDGLTVVVAGRYQSRTGDPCCFLAKMMLRTGSWQMRSLSSLRHPRKTRMIPHLTASSSESPVSSQRTSRTKSS